MKNGTLIALLFAALLAPAASLAEPYLAVRTGYKCMVCHVNPTGGGKRTEFGATYGQTALPAERLDLRTGQAVPSGGSEPASWTGKLNDQFAVGADLRANSQYVAVPHDTDSFAFTPRAQAYLEVKPIADRLTIYLDERVSPGAATNRETYALLWFANRTAYVKAGRMFVPFGLRIEDDSAFIRQVTGTSFNSSDDGVEGGLELGPWSAHLHRLAARRRSLRHGRGWRLLHLVTEQVAGDGPHHRAERQSRTRGTPVIRSGLVCPVDVRAAGQPAEGAVQQPTIDRAVAPLPLVHGGASIHQQRQRRGEHQLRSSHAPSRSSALRGGVPTPKPGRAAYPLGDRACGFSLA